MEIRPVTKVGDLSLDQEVFIPPAGNVFRVVGINDSGTAAILITVNFQREIVEIKRGLAGLIADGAMIIS